MTPTERDCFERVVLRIRRRGVYTIGYCHSDDIDAAFVRPDLDGAFTTPVGRAVHRRQAFRDHHERRS